MFGVIVNPVSGGREAAGLAVQITERIAALGEESRIFETGGDGDAAAQTRAALAAGCKVTQPTLEDIMVHLEREAEQ